MYLACPPELNDVTQAVMDGEYDIPGLDIPAPKILDLGANIGAFAAWAGLRWPGASIECYEPHPGNFEYLQENCPNALLIQAAVYDHNGQMALYEGQVNSSSCSLNPHLQASTGSTTVAVTDAYALPACDILKIDVEGSELTVLNRYQHLDTVQAVMVEWHGLPNRYTIGCLLLQHGLHIHSDAAWAVHFGVIKAVRDPSLGSTLYFG